MTKNLAHLFVVATLLFSSLHFVTHAITYVMVEDHHLKNQAQLIVVGTCVSVESGVGVRDQPRTLYTFKVEEVLKGSVSSNVRVTIDGGVHPTKGYGFQYHGYPSFQEEDRAMLLLSASAESGIYEIIHIFMGAFYDVEGFALRNIDKSEYSGQARDFQLFKKWLGASSSSSSLKRQESSTSYYRPKGEGLTFAAWREKTSKRYTLISGGKTTSAGNPAPRWFDFDTNTTVTWLTMDGDEYRDQFQRVVDMYQSIEGISITYTLGGTTNTTGGLNNPDGKNTLAWDDPHNEITGAFDCLVGGVVAVGGPKYTTSLVSFRGLQWNSAVEGDIVVQNGVKECGFRNSDLMEVLAHESGHTLGLGHSCGDAKSGTCNTNLVDNALMRAQAHFDGRGPSINQDDILGLEYLYCSDVGANCITVTGIEFTFTDAPTGTEDASSAISLVPSVVLLFVLSFLSSMLRI